MNKQQLASKIWETANQMRSKIEANEYKDYILGFIFYKYLSDKELQFLKKEEFTDKAIKALSESKTKEVKYIKENLGYFIAHENLFSTWIESGKDFDVSNVRDALSAFSRLINPVHEKLFKGIFDTLQTGLSKLGDTAQSQTKAISDLIQLVKDIPMNGKQDYDVLGYIYEYLIGMFAANAGKKAGEFYTPHEVSLLMSEIVADHTKNKKEISIYDPTSGSGSLLINIGASVAKHIKNENNIKYYAQELKENTYNLTRMNLVMRGILPDNIVARRGDTLEEDWPYFDENDKVNSYKPLYVDAVVSNPPYSQKWDSKDKDEDIRYKDFGLAPKTKADYAFLLHDLYHIKPDGIMAIVLPHGVLFRGGDEGKIRKNLIERNHVDAVIGLPANIFFGTGIPTIIMVLKRKRTNDDILIVDASKGFIKVGKNNKLRASDIKKIVDVVTHRKTVDKFSRLVPLDELRTNEYNLNIPRYVDSSENPETWDIYSSMFGGIPEKELAELNQFWTAFPKLKDSLFSKISSQYYELKTKEVKNAIKDHAEIKKFVNDFNSSFSTFGDYLKKKLLSKIDSVNVSKMEAELSEEIFSRLSSIPLIDKYKAYQILDDAWVNVSVDLEILQTEGFKASKVVDANMVQKKKDGKTFEVQEGWLGRVIPFDLVQEKLLTTELNSLKQKQDRLLEITSDIVDVIDSFSEEEKESPALNEAKDGFDSKELANAIDDAYSTDSEEISLLNEYLVLEDKKEAFIKKNTKVSWNKMKASKDGTYTKKVVQNYIKILKESVKFQEDSFESKLLLVEKLLTEEKTLKSQVKMEEASLHEKTKVTIEGLTDKEVYELLESKWIIPLVTSLNELPIGIVNDLTNRIQNLSAKYKITYSQIMGQIHETEDALSSLIDELTGNEFDVKGLQEFKTLLQGEKND
ncbi:MAG: type I restriction-modification system subunit M [Halobacteriovoraceae bacterium]|nr:type I restriction-modification system subunit M [Halobacteriovoraceae bacterium]